MVRFHILFGGLAILPFYDWGGPWALRPRITPGLPLSKIASRPKPPLLFCCPLANDGFVSEKDSELTISTRPIRTLPLRASDVPDGVFNNKTNTYIVFHTIISVTWRGD
jgi:hypothetical protein